MVQVTSKVMIDVRSFRRGLKIELDGVPYVVMSFQHVSPGKGSAFTRTKIKNMLQGNVIERTFKSGERVKKADVEVREAQYLYHDQEGYHLMDLSSYEQIVLFKDQIGEGVQFLQENTTIQISFFNGTPIGVELPNFVQLKVQKTAPSIRGDTVSGGTKPATLETGAVVSVPFHIREGDLLKIDTRDGSYVEKANESSK